MTDREDVVTQSAENDQAFDDLVCDVSAKLEAGEAVDLGAIASEYPEHVDRLRKLMPTLQAMAELGHSDTALFAASSKSPEPKELRTGVLGDYCILREIGRGGMGVVYEAEQVSLGRKVALKVLPFAAMLDQKQLQRFQNEARAAASLRHPNIVQVRFVGCERAVHFCAMDYIEGQTLAELIHHLLRMEELESEVPGDADEAVSNLADSLASGRFAPPKAPSAAYARTEAYTQERTPKGVAGVERSEPPEAETKRTPQAAIATERSTKSPAYFRSIAEIGVQVAEALDHAHEHGVIHRDIKPSNVILDNGGKPWVTDFGLARIETDATLTVSGDLLGTVRYMSPEQALAKRIVVDHRTDVYSLGATLYELLTLQPVFGGQDRQELLRQIAFEEPKAPRRLNKAIPGELEIIVLKAMAKNPAERYDTAQELADDLKRFLEDRPIRARRPTLLQRAAKWSRRHKPIVWSAAVLLVLATLGFASSTYLIAMEKARTEDALGQSRKAERQARGAEENERKLAKEAQRLKRQAEKNLKRAQDNLEQALDAAGQLVACLEDDRFFVEPEARELRQNVLKEALELFQTFIDENGTDPVVRYQTGCAYRRIAAIQEKLGRFKEAKRTSEQAISLTEQLVAEFPSDGKYRLLLAESYRELGTMLWVRERRLSAAERPLRCAAGLYEKLIADCPDVASYRNELIGCRKGLAAVLLADQKHQEVEEVYGQLTTEAEKLAAQFPAKFWYRSQVAALWGERGGLLIQTGRFEEAQEPLRRAQGIWEQLIAESPGIPLFRAELSRTHAQNGYRLKMQGELEAAEQSLRRGIALREEVLAECPLRTDWLQELPSWYHLLGDTLRKRQCLEEATQVFRRAVDASEKSMVLAPDETSHRRRLARSYGCLGGLLEHTDQFEKAEEAYRQAIKIEPTDAWCWLKLLDFEFARGASPETTQKLVAEAAAASGGYPVTFQHAAWNLLLNRRGDYEKICREAFTRRADSTDPWVLCNVVRAAALAKEPTVDTEQLVEMATRAVEAVAAEADLTALLQHMLGLCLLREGETDAAIERLNQSLGRRWGGAPVNWLGLAIAHSAGGRDSEAREWLRKAQEWFEQNPLDPTSGLHPADRIECQLLLREVEKLLGESEQEKGDDASEQEGPAAKHKPKDAEAAEPKPPAPEATSNAKPKEKQE